MNTSDPKDAIRRRLFLEAVRNGNRDPKYGFRLCAACGGRGSVCIERIESGRHTAAFEVCAECNGETIVPFD
ncbi:hypothetical protein [Ideonella sp.]|uniref:hypothetical protein n=1 Tax=Ideonella sp. TaxID=1929293 RepID=UPI003BB7A29C